MGASEKWRESWPPQERMARPPLLDSTTRVIGICKIGGPHRGIHIAQLSQTSDNIIDFRLRKFGRIWENRLGNPSCEIRIYVKGELSKMMGGRVSPQGWRGADRPLLESTTRVTKICKMWKFTGRILTGISIYNWFSLRALTIIGGRTIVTMLLRKFWRIWAIFLDISRFEIRIHVQG